MIERTIDLQRLYIYNAWANREALDALDRAAKPPAKSLERMGHLIGAEEVWLQRLRGEPSTAIVWPKLSLKECRLRLDALESGWLEYLQTLPTSPSGAKIQYTSTKGDSYESRVDDVLMHVFAHAAYHRGQIASDLRAAGYTPAITDFIFYTRDEALG